MTPMDKIHDIRTRLTTLMVECELLARDHDCASDALEDAVSHMIDAEERLGSAAGTLDEHMAHLDALAAGEPWAVSEARITAAQERHEFNRKVG